jgi:glycerol-3-phosphate acyltransferase PlsY
MYHGPPDVAPFVGLIVVLMALLVGLLVFVLTIVIWCKIFSKAGYCWALGLLMLVPIANLVMMLVLAFSDWPVHRELRLLRQAGPPAQVPPVQQPPG